MDVSMMELSKRRTLEGKNRKEGNGKPPRLFSLDMIPIDGCFEDVLQLWPLFYDVNCRLPPVIDGCFEDVLQQWPLFFVVDCRLPSDGSLTCCWNSRIPEEEEWTVYGHTADNNWCSRHASLKVPHCQTERRPVNSSHGQVVTRSTRHIVNSPQSTRRKAKLCRRSTRHAVFSSHSQLATRATLCNSLGSCHLE